jgi:acyl-CoA thioester hydrolase
MQTAAILHSAEQGWTMDRYRQHNAAWVVREHRIQYRLPALLGDELQVLTWVSNFRKVRSLRRYNIVRPADGSLLVIGETDWTFVGTATGAPRRVPEELANAFQVVDEADFPGLIALADLS